MTAVAIAVVLLLIGTLALQSSSSGVPSNPVASVDNGGPRGLLLLRLALEGSGHVVTVNDDPATLTDLVTDPARTVVLVPPPEQSAYSVDEVNRLRGLANRGARVVIACDGQPARRKRLRPLVEPTGLRCEALEDTAASTASVDVDGVVGVQRLEVLDRGRLVLDEARSGLLPWTREDDNSRVVVASAVVGAGEIVVLSSMSLWSNDGLRRADNAALLRLLTASRPAIVVDESHHLTRFDTVVARARLQGPGPRTAVLCALLLVPLALLSWSPRKGERIVDDDDDLPASSAADRIAGLAALLMRADPTLATTATTATTTTASTTTTTTSPAAGAPR